MCFDIGNIIAKHPDKCMRKVFLLIIPIMLWCSTVSAGAEKDIHDLQTAVKKINIAYTHWDIQGFKDAALLCDTVITRNPDNVTAWYWKGTALFFVALRHLYTYDKKADSSKGLHTIDQAIASLNHAIANDPENSESYALRGVLRGMRISLNPWSVFKHGPRVMQDRDTALELDPANPRVHYLTGMSFWHAPEILGGRDKALSHLLRAERLFAHEASEEHHPLAPRWGHDLCLACIGDIYRSKKDAVKARHYYQKALALNPADPVAAKGLKKLVEHKE